MALTPNELNNLHASIAPHLDAIGKLFRNPKITLIVRSPDIADADVVMSEDTLQAAMDAIARAMFTAPHLAEGIIYLTTD